MASTDVINHVQAGLPCSIHGLRQFSVINDLEVIKSEQTSNTAIFALNQNVLVWNLQRFSTDELHVQMYMFIQLLKGAALKG